jgi:fatty acid desaturase
VLEDPYADRGARRRRRALLALVVLVAAALGAARYLGHWPFGPPFWLR